MTMESVAYQQVMSAERKFLKWVRATNTVIGLGVLLTFSMVLFNQGVRVKKDGPGKEIHKSLRLSMGKIHRPVEKRKEPQALPPLSVSSPVFLALASSLESLQVSPYWDSGGVNIGYGYCITQRVASLGKERVMEDFKKVGIPDFQIQLLLSDVEFLQKQVTITEKQSKDLLALLEKEYTQPVKKALGGYYDTLPENQRAALVWIQYNTGNVHKFENLIENLKKKRLKSAKKNAMVYYYDKKGRLIENKRAHRFLEAVLDPKSSQSKTFTKKIKYTHPELHTVLVSLQ